MITMLTFELSYDGNRWQAKWAFPPDAHDLGVTPVKGKRTMGSHDGLGTIMEADAVSWFSERVLHEALKQIAIAWAIQEDQANPLF